MSNQVARTLRSAGVRRGDRVGIYVHKSLASIVSLFSILKAGGVYVPLDPNAPAKRLAYISRNCDLKVLLTSIEQLANMPQLLVEDARFETLVLTDDQALESVGAIETDLEYILYTSGSTGDHKGVMIAH